MTNPKIVIIILNWNNAPDTIACLATVVKLDYPNYQVLVVDNGSTDSSIELIKAQFPLVPILEMHTNLGYTGGNNIGIKQAREDGADWIFLLNNDTVLSENVLNHLIETGRTYPSAGILGPMVYQGGTHNVIQSAGGYIDGYWRGIHRSQNQIDQGQFSLPTPVHWVSGCAIMARCDMINQIGMLDERFFAYQEEIDWCIRARQANWQVMHVPQAHVWHWGSDHDGNIAPYVTYYMVRNRFLLLSKHKVGLLVWFITLAENSRTMLSWSIKPKWKSKKAHRNAMLNAICDFFKQY